MASATTRARTPALNLKPSLDWVRSFFPWGHQSGRPVSVGRAVTGFALAGLIAMIIIGLVLGVLLRRSATRQAIDEAERLTEVLGAGVVEPFLEDAIVTLDPASREALDRAVKEHVLSTSVVRIKIWTEDGLVVYSDESRIIGDVFPLDEDDLRSLRTGEVIAGVDTLDDLENRFDRHWGDLLEVYLPVHTPNGTALLFEAYLPYEKVAANSNQIWLDFVPALIGGLVLLQLLQLPLAFSLARRLKRGQEEREGLLLQALESSDRERRIIASELHDGVVQDLVGTAYNLTATADRLKGSGADDAVRALRQASTQSRRTIRELRSLLVDLYPPNLHSAGLEAALSDVVAPLIAKGVVVTLNVAAGLDMQRDKERLLYRGAREAVRNVLEHSNAQQVEVRVSANGGSFVLAVNDDGRGFDLVAREQRRQEGHMGLFLLEELVREAGGDLAIQSTNGQGTHLELTVPRS